MKKLLWLSIFLGLLFTTNLALADLTLSQPKNWTYCNHMDAVQFFKFTNNKGQTTFTQLDSVINTTTNFSSKTIESHKSAPLIPYYARFVNPTFNILKGKIPGRCNFSISCICGEQHCAIEINILADPLSNCNLGGNGTLTDPYVVIIGTPNS